MSEPKVRRSNSNPTTRTELTSMKRKYGVEPPEPVRRMSARLIEVSERRAKNTRLKRLIDAVQRKAPASCKLILDECTASDERNELLMQLKRDRLTRLIQAASQGRIRVCKAILDECGNTPHEDANKERNKLLGSKGGRLMQTPHYYAVMKSRGQKLQDLLHHREVFTGGLAPTYTTRYDDDPESREIVGYAGNAVGSDTTGFSALNRA